MLKNLKKKIKYERMYLCMIEPFFHKGSTYPRNLANVA